MTANPPTLTDADVDRLLESITKKLAANRGIVAKSLRHGRVTWRWKRGAFEITLEPTL